MYLFCTDGEIFDIFNLDHVISWGKQNGKEYPFYVKIRNYDTKHTNYSYKELHLCANDEQLSDCISKFWLKIVEKDLKDVRDASTEPPGN